jgi:hypothetical protein
MIDPADVFAEQTHGDKLGPYEDEQNRKEGEDPFRSPLRTESQAHEHEEKAESHSHGRHDPAQDAQGPEREGGHAGQKVKLKLDQLPHALL